MDQRARRAREREKRRLLDLAASCLARLLELYGTYLLRGLLRRRGFLSSLSDRPAGRPFLSSAVLGLVLC